MNKKLEMEIIQFVTSSIYESTGAKEEEKIERKSFQIGAALILLKIKFMGVSKLKNILKTFKEGDTSRQFPKYQDYLDMLGMIEYEMSPIKEDLNEYSFMVGFKTAAYPFLDDNEIKGAGVFKRFMDMFN